MICRVCSSHFKMQLFYAGSQLDYGLPQSAPEQCTPLYTVQVHSIGNICIAGYAFSRVIHRIQSELYFMETLTCIQHGYWLGAVDHPAYLLDLRTPPPHTFC
jgi:hypothetical protein